MLDEMMVTCLSDKMKVKCQAWTVRRNGSHGTGSYGTPNNGIVIYYVYKLSAVILMEVNSI